MNTLEQLRAAFDRELRQPYPAAAGERLSLVLLQVGEHAYALPIGQITAIHPLPRVGPVPARGERGLVGLATVRNAIVPVVDLAVALGVRSTPTAGRWLAIGRGDAPIGWTFDVLDAQVLIEPPTGGLDRTITIAGVERRVIDLEELRNAT